MKYEYQINWSDAYDNNLEIVTVRFASDPSVVPHSIPTSLLLERMKNLTCCTLYDRKNQTNPYNFLQITRVQHMPCHFPSLSSLLWTICSFNRMLALSAVFYCYCRVCVYFICCVFVWFSRFLAKKVPKALLKIKRRAIYL